MCGGMNNEGEFKLIKSLCSTKEASNMYFFDKRLK